MQGVAPLTPAAAADAVLRAGRSTPRAAIRSAPSCCRPSCRSPARRRRYDARRTRRSCSSCSASPSAGARRCARCRGRRSTMVVPAVQREHRRRARACRARYDFEVAAVALPRRARRRRRAARVPVQRHACSTPTGTGACRPGGSPGSRRRSTRCRSRSGARRWTATSRGAAGCGSAATSFARLAAYRSRHALATWDDVVDRLLAAEAGA